MNCELSMYGYLKEAILDKSKEKLIFYNYRMKGDELFSLIDSLAFYLINLGVKKGQTIGICLPNIPQAAISLYAVNRIGAIANVIHPKVSAKALKKIIDETDTKILFLFDKSIAAYQSLLNKKGITIISCSASSFLKGIKKAFAKAIEPKTELEIIDFADTIKESGQIDEEFSPYDDAIYLHSGGTTGDPKTVRLSSYAFNKLADNVIKRTSLNHVYKTEHSMLMVLPLFHGFGLGICIHLALSNFRLVMMPLFSAVKAIKLIKKHKINYLAGIPVMFEKFLQEKTFDGKHLSNLELIFCGADKLNQSVKEEFDKTLRKNYSTAEVLEGYGLSEVASVATVNITGQSKNGTQGKPIDGVKIKILNEKKQQCKTGENGEVVIQSQSMMNGYLKEKEIKNYFYIDENNEKWLRTGDIGSIDSQGYFTFKSREKRIIKIAGVNIFPAEIEQTVLKMKEIDAACVVRTVISNKPCTKLIIKMNKSYRYSILIEQRIKNLIAEEFIHYAIPSVIQVTDKIHTTPLGKVDYIKYEKQEKK